MGLLPSLVMRLGWDPADSHTELVTPEDVFNCLMYIGVSSAAAGSTISVDHIFGLKMNLGVHSYR